MTDHDRKHPRIAMVDLSELPDRSPLSANMLARVMAQAATLRPAFSGLIRAIMNELTLPPLEREIAILAVIFLDRGHYECAQHRAVAQAMGISAAKVEAIAEEQFDDPVFDAREKSILAFVRQAVKLVRVDDPTFERLRAFYDDRQLVELIYLVGTYMTIVRISEIARVPFDGLNGPENWKVAQRV